MPSNVGFNKKSFVCKFFYFVCHVTRVQGEPFKINICLLLDSLLHTPLKFSFPCTKNYYFKSVKLLASMILLFVSTQKAQNQTKFIFLSISIQKPTK